MVRAALDERDRGHRRSAERRVIVPISAPSSTNGSPTPTPASMSTNAATGEISAAAVHAFDEFLTRVAPLRETHRHRHHPRRCRNRLARNDVEAHAGPAGSDASSFVAIGGLRRPSGFHDDLRGDADLEPIQPDHERLTESGVDVEVESVVCPAGDARERLDLAGRLERERPRGFPDREFSQVLGHL